MALLLLGLCDPNLVQENRRPLKDIVAVVVDRSGSQDIGERPRQTDKARDELETRLKALGDVDLRVVETSREESETEGTKLFAALRGALADAPPERVGGAIMITDGDVHDIPQSAAALGFNAPLHALITGHEGERQRRIELGRGAALRHRRQGSGHRRARPRQRRPRRAGQADGAARRRDDRRRSTPRSASGSRSRRRSTIPGRT